MYDENGSAMSFSLHNRSWLCHHDEHFSRTVVDLVIQSKMVRRCCVLYSTEDCYVIMIITLSLTVDVFIMIDVNVAISRILIGTIIR